MSTVRSPTRSLHGAILFALLFPSIVHAQSTTPIIVDWNGEDDIGRQLTFELREAIRRSAGYRLVDKDADALIKVAIMSIGVPEFVTDTNSASAIAVAYTGWPGTQASLLNLEVLLLGRLKTGPIAKSMLATIDNLATTLRKVAGR